MGDASAYPQAQVVTTDGEEVGEPGAGVLVEGHEAWQLLQRDLAAAAAADGDGGIKRKHVVLAGAEAVSANQDGRAHAARR